MTCISLLRRLVPAVLLVLIYGVPFAHAQVPIHASQPSMARTSVFVELLGNGGLYSVNVERLVGDRLALRAGVGAWQTGDLFGMGTTSLITVPVMASTLFGAGSNRIEVGAGVLAGRRSFDSAYGPQNSHDTTIFDLTGFAGYRYQAPAGGLLFRAGLTPFYALSGGENAYPDTGLFLSGGLSVGYSF